MATPAGAIYSVPQIYGNGLVFLAGSVTFKDGAGTVGSTLGKGFTISRTGVGTYTVTTQAFYKAAIAVSGIYNVSGGAEGLDVCRSTFATNQVLTLVLVNTAGVAKDSTVTGNGFDFVVVGATSVLSGS